MEPCRFGSFATIFLLLSLAATGPARAQEAVHLHLDPAKALTQYRIDSWTVRDGLPQNSITAIIQTRDGYLWFGTQEGLARYDGRAFEIFDRRQGALPDNTVTTLLEDSSGRLWIGTDNGLACYESGAFRTITMRDGLGGNRISALEEDHDGRIWAGTLGEGASAITDSSIITFGPERGFPATDITSIYQDPSGVLWFGTLDAGLVRMKGGEFTSFDRDDGLPGSRISQLLPSRDGSLWIGTYDGGIGRMSDGRFERFSLNSSMAETNVQVLHEDGIGTLWVGMLRGGLGRYAHGTYDALTKRDGLTYEDVLALYTDREGSLWIGTDGGGLNRLRDGKVTTFTAREGLANDYVYTVMEASDGSVWTGTDAGLTRLSGRDATSFTAADGLPDDWVITLAETDDGAVWLGTPRNGLARYDGESFRTFTRGDGLPSNAVFVLYRDSRGRLLAGTGRGLAVFDGSRFTPIDGLADFRITTIAEAGPGSFWVGTMGEGVALVEGSQVVRWLNPGSGLSAERILDFYVDSDGTLWIGTWGEGLVRYRDGTFRTISIRQGLFDENVFSIREDGRGKLWITCNKGLYSVDKAQLNAVADGSVAAVTPDIFGYDDGLPSPEFNGGYQPAAWRGSGGRLWFPSTGGLVSVDPARIPINRVPPPVVLQSVTADGTTLRPDEVAEFPPGTHRLEFRYAGLSFAAPSGVRYRYFLEGDDAEWVDAGARHETYYTNLKPGSYTFRVAAQNADGIWSDQPAAVSFSIRPHFYQTTLFYILCLLVTGLSGVGLLRLRLRKLTTRQRELEQLVGERTASLRREMERSDAARREAEAQRQVIEEQARRLRELDQIKTDFFHNISHEFRTPLTLTIGPLENVLMGSYGRVNAAVQEQFQIVLRNARRLLRLINQVLDLAKIESGGLEIVQRPIDLRPLLIDTVESFTVLTEAKNVSLSLDIQDEAVGVLGDADRLEKVFFNLVSNAVKFTPGGGAIRVKARRVDDDVEVEVRDTGVGIPEEQLPHIFKRFHQVGGADSQVQAGTGIGLAFARELVELHHGSITVESQHGEGSCFTVRLPGCEMDVVDVAADAAPLATLNQDWLADDSASNVAPADAPRILLVDDNADIRAYVASCLSDAFHVEAAPDGDRALERIREGGIDLVVSDVSMPVMDGYELCRAVRSDEAHRHLPFIMLTARADQADRLQGLRAGTDDYVPKPFDAEELRVRITNLLQLRARQNELRALNAELQQKNIELGEALELKSRLIGVAAHDLKNPLNALREFTRILQEEVDSPDAHIHDILQVMYDSTDQMLQRVARLLHSAALESGNVRLDRKVVDLREVAQRVVRRYAGSASRKNQTIELHGGSVYSRADNERIGEAIENLVNNAVKYSPEGGRIEVRLEEDDRCVRLSVSDQGPGLSDADVEKLFGQFQRLSAQPTGGESSFGLGLSIVRQIVELHEGRVYARSNENQGAMFVIELPLVEAVGAVES